MNLLFNASNIPSALMFAALNEQDFLCRVFGNCLTGDPLDREVGEQLGANLVVEGSVLRSGGRLRINAQLIQVAGDVPPQAGPTGRQS